MGWGWGCFRLGELKGREGMGFVFVGSDGRRWGLEEERDIVLFCNCVKVVIVVLISD